MSYRISIHFINKGLNILTISGMLRLDSIQFYFLEAGCFLWLKKKAWNSFSIFHLEKAWNSIAQNISYNASSVHLVFGRYVKIPLQFKPST